MKTIIVCCATSMVTSTIAINKISSYLKENGIDANIIQCKFIDVDDMVKRYNPDLVVPTGALKEDRALGVPVVKGTSFVTGINEDLTLEKIKNVLQG